MNQLFAFRPREEGGDGSQRRLAVYSPADELPESDVWDTLTEDIGKNLRPDSIIFLVRENAKEQIGRQLERLTENNADWRVSLEETTVGLACFRKDGSFDSFVHIKGPEFDMDAAGFARLFREGAREIFFRRDGFIRPSPSTHFVHPSNKHSQGFMRVANLMVAGPEVSFLAVGVLRYLSESLAYICVDTSSIAIVAYAALGLRAAFDSEFRPPIVNSFSSWQGLRGGYKFDRKDATLVLVSASSSGRMAADLTSKHNFPNDRVLTLFSRAPSSAHLNILCDLNGDSRLGPAEDLVEYRDGECPLCNRGSLAVHFVGDQFLADDIRFGAILPLAKDATANLAPFLERYHGSGALRLGISGSGEAVNEYRIALDRLTATKQFRNRFEAMARRYIPASCKAVVTLDDSGSQTLAQQVQSEFCPPGTEGPITAEGLRARDANSITGAVAIVAGAIRSGGSLQSIARDLRDPAGSQPRIFLGGVSKHSQLSRHKHLRNDLAFNSGPRHTVVFAEELVLPTVTETSAWESEWTFLTKLLDPLASTEVPEAVRKALEARQDAIATLASGQVDGVFWPAPDGSPLRLRQTFAFWKAGYDPQRASQVDVLWTIASLLEAMRCSEPPKLQRSAFHQVILSPSTFGRYNDGIIQAAFLRAAKSHELDFSGDRSLSADMARLLRKVISDWSDPRGEAASEFLIALATGRLRLRRDDLEVAIELPGNPPPVLTFLRDLARQALNG